ncbi:HisA/HisF-related TIM barrel protein [Pseudoalteromonas shioyasakiensis]|uniref:HisA/HisF-related TIM barrel protein n=1 Tax=Pseudoalteromonas shioyasakiensis TaxID=1190813 RepID=UPI0021194083|nr:HisA/HisF-related TIM barrel protein [Pseudoalteromonas shioyasakiensis]
MRLVCRIEVKNNWVVKGVQYEGVGKVLALDKGYRIPSNDKIEEVILLDLTRSVFGLPPNFMALEIVAENTNLPITFGGGIDSVEAALKAFELGASKVYLNSSVTVNETSLVNELVKIVGRQAITIGCEYRIENGQRMCYGEAGREPFQETLTDRAIAMNACGAGEIVVSHIESDGIEKGFDWECLDELPPLPIPIILASGGSQAELDKIQGYESMKCEALCFSKVFNNDYG